jgi:hypothetical protein
MNRKAIIITVALLVVIGLGAGVWFFLFKKPSVQAPTTSTAGPVQLPNTTQGFPDQATQYKAGLSSSNSYPDLATIIRAAEITGWRAEYINAIKLTYNQTNGQARQGDWLMQVVGVNPIVTRWTKGSEQFSLSASI